MTMTTTDKKIEEIVSLAKGKKEKDEPVLDAVLELLKSDPDKSAFLLKLLGRISSSVDSSELSAEQKRVLEERSARYERGEGRSYTWEETKRMVRMY